jgi:Kef-type K+ transport system membrane component KefB
VLTCVSGFGIFQRGGFNIAHMLGVTTLLVLGLAAWAERGRLGGALAPYLATVGFSLSYFFHWIPGTTETFTRFPLGAPLFSSPEDPNLEKTIGVLFLLFLAGAAVQVWRLRARGAAAPVGRTA